LKGIILAKEDDMSFINFINKSTQTTDKKTQTEDRSSGEPQLISEDATLGTVNDEYNQYVEYYMDMIRNKSKGTVLIVEDDFFCRAIMEKTVRDYSLDLKIITAVSEVAALEILKATPVDLVISDYYLEGPGTGLDLCKKVIANYPNTKCVMMSSMNFPQYAEVASKTPASPEFMEKPVKPSLIKKYLTSFFQDLYFKG
jgi:CheY-like chemotaxis protein